MIGVLIIIAIVGVLVWAVNVYLPMQPWIKKVFNIVAVLLVVLWLLKVFGVLDYVSDPPPPRL